MNVDEKVIAFIPIRGGSKSIPFKNIKLFCGKPLAYWTIKAASDCCLIDEVYVATDNEEIYEVVKSFSLPKVSLYRRSDESATDVATTEFAMLEFASQYGFRHIVLIQATSPLLESNDLEKGIDLYLNGKYDSLLSGVEQKRFVWLKKETYYIPQNYNPKNRPRRQDMNGYFVENGAFYITSKANLMNTKCRLFGKIGLYPMKEDTYFEIDEPGDWIVAEELKWNRLINDKKNNANKINLLISDVDGVLTDAGMYYNKWDDELKKFNTRDGKGFEVLKKRGIKIMLMTSEKVNIVQRRAIKLNVDFLFMGIKDKKQKVEEFFQTNKEFSYDGTAYIGDDINDIEVMKKVAFSATPRDGMKEVKKISSYICKNKGGEGCVREFCDIISRLRGEDSIL